MANEFPILNGLLQSDLDVAGYNLDSCGNLEQNSGSAHDLHNVSDKVTNYERFRLAAVSNVWTLASENGGTGTLRDVKLARGSGTYLWLGSSGVGINVAAPTCALDVSGDVKITGSNVELSGAKLGAGTTPSSSSWCVLGAPTTALSSLRWTAGPAPSSPVAGDAWNDSTQQCLKAYLGGVTQADARTIFTATANAGPSNTADETSVVGTGVGTLTLPANFLVAGKTLAVRVSGYFQTATGTTLTIKVKLASTAVATITVTPGATAADKAWQAEVSLTCRTTGVTGTVMGQALAVVNAVAAGTVNTAASTVDTTGSLALDVTATLSNASASDYCYGTNVSVEVLN